MLNIEWISAWTNQFEFNHTKWLFTILGSAQNQGQKTILAFQVLRRTELASPTPSTHVLNKCSEQTFLTSSLVPNLSTISSNKLHRQTAVRHHRRFRIWATKLDKLFRQHQLDTLVGSKTTISYVEKASASFLTSKSRLLAQCLVVQAFKNSSIIPWKIRNKWSNAISRLCGMNCIVTHIFREGNQVADSLANHGFRLFCVLVYHSFVCNGIIS